VRGAQQAGQSGQTLALQARRVGLTLHLLLLQVLQEGTLAPLQVLLLPQVGRLLLPTQVLAAGSHRWPPSEPTLRLLPPLLRVTWRVTWSWIFH
jgi:hypothetical protein